MWPGERFINPFRKPYFIAISMAVNALDQIFEILSNKSKLL